ncbi:MAG: hypothetical protein ACRDHP_10050, partial [Ktedonobacterales bacterium]
MGKLLEKLREIGQGTNAGFGFMSSARAQGRAPRPAAILIAVSADESAVAESAVKSGADGILL